MSALDDYLPCPALARWLPQRLAPCVVRHAITPGTPARLRRFAAQWPAHDGDATSCDALVIVASLRRPLPAALLQSVALGTLVVEVAAVGGLRLGERLFGIPARRSIHRLTARRLTGWLHAGVGDIEQWLTTDPPDTFVTVGVAREPLLLPAPVPVEESGGP